MNTEIKSGCTKKLFFWEKQKNKRYIRFTNEASRKIDSMILRNIPNDLDIIKYKIDKERK